MTDRLRENDEDCLSSELREEWGFERVLPFSPDREDWSDWWGNSPAADPEEWRDPSCDEAELDPLRPRPTDEESDSLPESAEDRPTSMINRGRGPELAGTRITVYRIMDYLRDNDSPSEIAAELGITDEQVQFALDYIDRNRTEVEAKYQLILERVNRSNPPGIDEVRAKTLDELRRRIRERRAGEGARDRPVGQ